MKHTPSRALLALALASLGIGAFAAPSTASLAASDRAFIEKAAAGGLAEVELGQLAQQKAQNDQVKQFGARIAQDHAKANDELKQLAAAKGVTLPSDPGPHQKDIDRLAALSGDRFDRAYMYHMVKDHKQDVKAFQSEARTAKDPEVKGFASRTLPTLEEHLKLAQATESAVKGGRAPGSAAVSGNTANLSGSADSTVSSHGTTSTPAAKPKR